MSDCRIQLKDLTKIYPGQTEPAVKAVNMDIPEGEIVVLVGPSGCGKTTTMKMVNRLIEPTSGEIFLSGENVTKVAPDDLRRRIGYVIQQIGLFPHQTIRENIATVPSCWAGTARASTSASTSCSRPSGSTRRSTATGTPRRCRAASASASAWPARWPPTPRSC